MIRIAQSCIVASSALKFERERLDLVGRTDLAFQRAEKITLPDESVLRDPEVTQEGHKQIRIARCLQRAHSRSPGSLDGVEVCPGLPEQVVLEQVSHGERDPAVVQRL